MHPVDKRLQEGYRFLSLENKLYKERVVTEVSPSGWFFQLLNPLTGESEWKDAPAIIIIETLPRFEASIPLEPLDDTTPTGDRGA